MKLSIIVPVYNVEAYLDECMYSIVHQNFDDFEVICINDGSTDGSLSTLNKWSDQDSRIRILSVENGGVSKARNLGFGIAQGEYVGFVDSDDYIHPDMFMRLVRLMDSNSLDVVGCSFVTDRNDTPIAFSFRTDCVLGFRDAIASSSEIQTSNDLCFPWRFLIRRSVLDTNGICMNESIRIGEDMIFMMHVLSVSQRVLFTNEGLYHYRTSNENSLMHLNSYKPYLEDSYTAMYFDKKAIIKQYGWDDYTNMSFDLARYTILVYLPYLLKNRKMKTGELLRSDVCEVLRMQMIRDAFRIIGFKNIFTNCREYLFYILEKFIIIPLVMRVVKVY